MLRQGEKYFLPAFFFAEFLFLLLTFSPSTSLRVGVLAT
jgi:hypothetical protein